MAELGFQFRQSSHKACIFSPLQYPVLALKALKKNAQNLVGCGGETVREGGCW